tara:strand:- start:69 stop:305 length:237 start_codon:yes stop_codon:yes gene_type:complete
MARVWFVPPQETETDRKYHPFLAGVLRSGEGEIEIGNRVSSTFLFSDDDDRGNDDEKRKKTNEKANNFKREARIVERE